MVRTQFHPCFIRVHDQAFGAFEHPMSRHRLLASLPETAASHYPSRLREQCGAYMAVFGDFDSWRPRCFRGEWLLRCSKRSRHLPCSRVEAVRTLLRQSLEFIVNRKAAVERAALQTLRVVREPMALAAALECGSLRHRLEVLELSPAPRRRHSRRKLIAAPRDRRPAFDWAQAAKMKSWSNRQPVREG